MKKLVFLVTVLSAVVVATPALSQTRPELGVSFASDSLTVPVMINAGGLAGATFATYAALMNPTSKSFAVQVTVFDGTGAQVSTLQFQLGPNALGQRAVIAAVSGGYVRFDPSRPASCYAVVANNSTNDARFIPAVEFTP